MGSYNSGCIMQLAKKARCFHNNIQQCKLCSLLMQYYPMNHCKFQQDKVSDMKYLMDNNIQAGITILHLSSNLQELF